ncbi:hypothetical protein MHU86_13572 [Fragilaria crotonensis]|nr:hypothetical protein MHU86_13572 [Fragilaria crotonensis]
MLTFANCPTQPTFKHAADILTPSLTTFELFATFPKHIIDGPPDARTAILTLRRHCAPLTPDHVERTREAFCSIKQPHHEVATSYLNRIRLLTRDCYHAGIPNTDAELIKRTVRGGSNHSFYAASYQRFDADIRRAELNDEALPPFAELESHLLNIDESRGLTLPSQNHRNYNQHANAARGHHSHHSQPRHNQTTQRVFTQRQQQAFSSILRPYSNPSSNNQNRNQPPRLPQNHSRPFRPPTNPSRPPFNNSNQRRPPPPSRGHPTSLNETIDHLSDRRPVLINVHLLTDPTTTIRATLPMPLQSSAITADASATMRATAQTPDQTKTITPPTHKDHPTMKTLLPATNNAPTSSLTLAKTHQTNQDTTTKPFQPHLLTTLMVTHPTSLGPILTYLR